MTSTTSRPLVVGVHDEPALIVAGVRAMLHRTGTDGRVQPLGDSAPDLRVDVVLCDPLRHDGHAEAAAYVAAVRDLVGAPAVGFSWSTAPDDVRRVLAAGVSAYVSKQAGAEELVRVLERARQADPDLADRPRVPGWAVALTDREAAVLQLICQGLSNDEIAESLFVSVNSVKVWVGQVYRKIGVTRRARAVAWGITHDY